MVRWPEGLKLREWQHAARTAYHRGRNGVRRKTTTISAIPGAGKTTLGLVLAHDELEEGGARRLIVVSHTTLIQSQWQAGAADFGIPLATDLPVRWERGAGNGLTLTYQQVAMDPVRVRALVTEAQRVLVLFDEIHLVADSATWGTAVRTTFGRSTRRILLTGTPFREDEAPIQFVEYRQRRAVVDFTYGYAEALRDGVVAPVYFRTLDGEVRWQRGDERFLASMGVELAQHASAERLRALLDPDHEWMIEAISQADHQLREFRGSHPLAKGLIVCLDQRHAERIATLVERVTGEAPVLAISDYSDSHARIRAFRDGAGRWLVAVRMVSEGVDIPHLRVGVFATNVVTELFFRQWVGRFVRIVPGLEGGQSAILYLPQEERLLAHARNLSREQAHELRSASTEALSHLGRLGMAAPLTTLGITVAAGMTLSGGDGGLFSDEELAQARAAQATSNLHHIPVEDIARLLRAFREQGLGGALLTK